MRHECLYIGRSYAAEPIKTASYRSTGICWERKHLAMNFLNKFKTPLFGRQREQFWIQKLKSEGWSTYNHNCAFVQGEDGVYVSILFKVKDHKRLTEFCHKRGVQISPWIKELIQSELDWRGASENRQ